MSAPMTFTITCGYCGVTANYVGWASSYSFGSPDLDTRPPEDDRFTMNTMLVKKCKSCAYCNANIKEIPDNLEAIINSKKYQDLLSNEEFPEKAIQFLCKSLILDGNYDLEGAAWASLHAAWNCDDAEKPVQAKYCRERSIELFYLANATNSLHFEKKVTFQL
ncbi:MAG: hypothetical protein Q8R96_15190 [Bacteroidota bacterium]|nr:hypothetical protein [Bacteroidota bacterium]